MNGPVATHISNKGNFLYMVKNIKKYPLSLVIVGRSSNGYLAPLEGVPLLKVLLVFVLVHKDEVDLPHAIVEEQRVRLVVEVGLRRETRAARQLGGSVLVHLVLHDTVHDGTADGRQPVACLGCGVGHAGGVGGVNKHRGKRPSPPSDPKSVYTWAISTIL